jgi:hypothetical protein
LIGKPCKKVQSFGALTYFTKENKPAGAPARCTDGCPHVDTCFYNDIKVYFDDKNNTWFRSVVANTVTNPSDEAVIEALRTGPYGRCVYYCDNDVVDHQIVNMEFEDMSTASLSMNAFNKGGRFIHIFGTEGEITMGKGHCQPLCLRCAYVLPEPSDYLCRRRIKAIRHSCRFGGTLRSLVKVQKRNENKCTACFQKASLAVPRSERNYCRLAATNKTNRTNKGIGRIKPTDALCLIVPPPD